MGDRHLKFHELRDKLVTVLDHDEDVEAGQEDGVDVGEVDGEDRVGLRREELSPRRAGPRGAGSRLAPLKISHAVEAVTRWPSPISSPCVRL